MNARVLMNKSCYRFVMNPKVLEGLRGVFVGRRVHNNISSFWHYRNIHGNSQVVHVPQLLHQTNRKTSDSISTSTANPLERVLLENREIIAELLGINPEDVNKIPCKMIDKGKAKATFDVLQKFNFPSSSIHRYPEILLVNRSAVENYIRIMQETGFPNIREMFILRFRTIYRQNVSVLRNMVTIPPINNIVERYCAELEEDDTFLKTIIQTLPQNCEKVSLFDLRNSIMAKYLGKMLLNRYDESVNMDIFAKYPRLHYRCFNWIKRNYNILLDFGFPTEKIKSHCYLLHADPNNLSRVTKIESLAEMDIKKIFYLRPKIMMSAFDSLIEIDNIFRKHRIPFESVQKYPEVYTLSAATIRERLNEIDTIPEFQSLKGHPRIVRLLYYYNKAKFRLEELNKLDMHVPSLHLLSSDTKRFNKTLSGGEFRVRGVDITIYLSNVFQVNRQRIRESLMRHPHWLHIPLVNIKCVLKFIQSVNSFKTDQLIDAIPILLYPKDKVAKEIEYVMKSGEASLKDDYFLQMVLYNLERASHFTGDAVWPEKDNHPEFEDDAVPQKTGEKN